MQSDNPAARHLENAMTPQDKNRFNTPAEMFVRLVYASQLFFFIAGACATAMALSKGSVYIALEAVLFFAAMITGHVWLRRTGKLDECDKAFNQMMAGGDAPHDELDDLLERRASLELRRGTPAFDPWEVQAVRREINDYVRQHPESTSRLDDSR